jgi:hypothetical protein
MPDLPILIDPWIATAGMDSSISFLTHDPQLRHSRPLPILYAAEEFILYAGQRVYSRSTNTAIGTSST